MLRILLTRLSLVTLAARRIWYHRLLMLCLLVGLTAAVGLLTGIPLYADAAQNKLLQGELTEAGTHRPPFAFLWRYVGAWDGNVDWKAYLPVNTYLTEQAPAIINLSLESQARYVATANLRLFPTAAAAFVPDEPLLWAGLGFITNLADHIQIVEGEMPAETPTGDTVEILVSRVTAETLGLQVGEQYIMADPAANGVEIPVQISGVWQPTNPADPFWFYAPDTFDAIFLTSETAFVEQVTPVLETPVASAVWYQIFDGSRIRPATVGTLLADISTVEARATALLNNTTLHASPAPALESYGDSASTLTLMLTVFSLPVLGLIAYFISLIAGMVVKSGQSEIAIMRGRGITRRQIVNIYLLEGLLIGGLGLAGGMVLGRSIAQLMSRSRTFLDPTVFSATGVESLAIVFTPTAYLYALIGVGLTLVALLVPALATAKHSIVTLRWEQARTLIAPFWQRYFLDLFLLVPPFYGWYQLSRQGGIALGGGADPFSNPLLFLVPILFCFSVGLFLLRFFPLLMKGLAWLADWLPSVTLLVTLRQLARSTTQYMGPLLLLSLTVSLATFSASMAVTLDKHLRDQVYYQLGADMQLGELGESTEESETVTLQGQEAVAAETDANTPQWLFLPVSEHLNVPGVEAAARVGNYQAVANIGGRQQPGRLLGLDRLDFPQVAFFRSDFAYNEALGGVMNRLGASRDSILVSSDFLTQHALTTGDPLRLTVEASGIFAEVNFTIAGGLELFPTLYPQDGPFFVANLDYIHTALGGTYPYDVWLTTNEAAAGTGVVEGVRDLGIVVVTAQDARQTILAEQTRPERQGLFGLLSVGFIAAAVLTVIGFLVYAVMSFQRRYIELGMLRAIGLSVGQMAAFLAGELAALIATGLALGGGLGIWASRLFIPYFQVGTDKTATVPPFNVQLAWTELGFIFMLFGLMFVVAVVVLAALLVRMRIFEAVKLGETV